MNVEIHPKRKYLHIEVDDYENANIKEWFSRTNKFIEEAKSEGKKCLVHCAAGISSKNFY